MTAAIPYRLLIDADVLIKLSILDCFSECIAALGLKLTECATMRSMTRSAGLDNPEVRERRVGGPGKASRRLHKTLYSMPTIDNMSLSEKQLSAEINLVAQKFGLFFDGGEAMLASVSIHRGLPFVTTGDKKAMRSLPVLAQHIEAVGRLKGKLLPLELLLLRTVQSYGLPALHARWEEGKACDGSVRHVLDDAGADQALFETGLIRKLGAIQAHAPGFVVF